MWTWLEENWTWLLPALLYIIERVPEINAEWKRRCAAAVDGIEAYSRAVGKEGPVGEALTGLKASIGARLSKRDNRALGDLISEAGDDKHERSNVRKIADGALRLLPLYSRIMRARNGR